MIVTASCRDGGRITDEIEIANMMLSFLLTCVLGLEIEVWQFDFCKVKVRSDHQV